jgi:hypothetical protein
MVVVNSLLECLLLKARARHLRPNVARANKMETESDTLGSVHARHRAM